MNFSKRFGLLPFLGIYALSLGLSACGSDSSSESVENPPDEEYSSSAAAISSGTESSSASGKSSASQPLSSGAVQASSSSAATETVSGNEALNEANQVVNGTCGPESPTVEKGELVTWKFYRASGEIFEQIMSPFVWTFEGVSNPNIQGNGLYSVNVRYAESGTYSAYLNVDGNEVACEPIQVQGIPITVNSCVPNVSTAKAGETITWTVDAVSESPISTYEWTSAYGTVSGSGASASMVASSDMHKQQVTVNVAVSNADNSKVTYACGGVTVVDPESVDLILPLGNINDPDSYGETILPTLPDSIFIPAQTATTVQIPAGAPNNCTVGCKPRVGADYRNLEVYWDSEEPLTGFAYFSPTGCAPGKKYTVTATTTTICVVNK